MNFCEFDERITIFKIPKWNKKKSNKSDINEQKPQTETETETDIKVYNGFFFLYLSAILKIIGY